MNCATCGQTTKPLHVGGDDYCSNCGNLYKPATAASTHHRGLDLSPRHKVAPPQPAAALHHRAASKHVIDLRAAATPTTPQRPAARQAPDHAGHSHAEPVATSPAAAIMHDHGPRAAAPSGSLPGRHRDTDPHFSTRLNDAKQVSRSPVIKRFAGARLPDVEPALSNESAEPAPAHLAPVPPPRAITPPHAVIKPAPSTLPAPRPAATLPPHAATQHAAMSQLKPLPPQEPATSAATQKTSHHNTPHKRLAFSPHHRRLAATAAAVVLMGGYIWLNNYPKLAIQNADAKAGISATMPSFIPSSYTLAHTASSPGLITLKFTSPSAAQALTIAQERSNWDSNSLLDNYVTNAADDYAAVTGQGLTIYLFGNNNATWVNHGIWYSMQGASQLSRDQILKIAYSL